MVLNVHILKWNGMVVSYHCFALIMNITSTFLITPINIVTVLSSSFNLLPCRLIQQMDQDLKEASSTRCLLADECYMAAMSQDTNWTQEELEQAKQLATLIEPALRFGPQHGDNESMTGENLNEIAGDIEGEARRRRFADRSTLVRYLRACRHKVNKAYEALLKTLAWREEVDADNVKCSLCQEDPHAHSLRLVGFDIRRRPVLYTSLQQATGRHNAEASAKHMQQVLEHTTHVLRRVNAAKARADRHDQAVEKVERLLATQSQGQQQQEQQQQGSLLATSLFPIDSSSSASSLSSTSAPDSASSSIPSTLTSHLPPTTGILPATPNSPVSPALNTSSPETTTTLNAVRSSSEGFSSPSQSDPQVLPSNANGVTTLEGKDTSIPSLTQSTTTPNGEIESKENIEAKTVNDSTNNDNKTKGNECNDDEEGDSHGQWVLIIDFLGYGMRDNNPMAAVLLKQLLAHYPERLGLAILIDAPMIFSGLWALLRPLLDENTSKKVVFVKSKHLLNARRDHNDEAAAARVLRHFEDEIENGSDDVSNSNHALPTNDVTTNGGGSENGKVESDGKHNERVLSLNVGDGGGFGLASPVGSLGDTMSPTFLGYTPATKKSFLAATATASTTTNGTSSSTQCDEIDLFAQLAEESSRTSSTISPTGTTTTPASTTTTTTMTPSHPASLLIHPPQTPSTARPAPLTRQSSITRSGRARRASIQSEVAAMEKYDPSDVRYQLGLGSVCVNHFPIFQCSRVSLCLSICLTNCDCPCSYLTPSLFVFPLPL